MNSKILISLLFLGWTLLCCRIYVCRIKQVCKGQVQTLVPSAQIVTDPTVSTPDAGTIPAANTSASEATAAAETASSEVPSTEPAAQYSSREKPQKSKTKPTKEVFDAPEGEVPAGEQSHVTIEESANEAILHFPYNSTRKVDNEEMDSYLTKLATRIKSNNETILVTGHTDGIGDGLTNNDLALKRAQSIKSILIKKGVSAGSITCRSFGERKPVASDDTPQGRYKNRRAVITIQ
jgi:outer membrane protein OmpA-like peptidoglycan-associated protein